MKRYLINIYYLDELVKCAHLYAIDADQAYKLATQLLGDGIGRYTIIVRFIAE